MRKQLHLMLLLAAIFFAPWVARGQSSLSDYILTVDTVTFNSIVSTGTPLTFTSTDDGYATVTLPFSIGFGESAFSAGASIACSANGFLQLGSTSTSGTTASYSSATNSYITPMLQVDAHLARHTGSGCYYLYDTTAGTFTIEYHLLGRYSSPYGAYSYQIVFHSNSTIEIIYDSVNLDGGSPTLATYLTDAPNNDRVFLAGAWALPSMVTSYTTRPTSPLPAHGLRYTFIRPTVSCPKPLPLDVSNITANGFDISWIDTTYSGEYAVRLLQGTNVVYSGTVTDTNMSFTLLNANTEYIATVATICGLGDTSTWRSAIVRTECDLLNTLPYTETFESAATGGSTSSTFVSCWNRLNNGTSYFGYPYVNSSTTYNHTPGGTKGLYWYNTTTTGSYGDYQCIVLPPFNDSIFSTNSLRVSFWAKASSTSYNPVFQVGVMTDPLDINTFTTVGTVNVSGTSWNEHTVSLQTYTDSGTYIAIRADRPSSSWYAYVDDITLDIIPLCPEVEDLAASQITTNSCLISWDEQDTATSWTVEYGPTGFTVGTGTSQLVTTDTLTLTGLAPNTLYDVYVVPTCTDNRGGRASISIRTNCLGLDTLPFFEDFETAATGSSTSNSFLNCWHHMNNGSDYPGYPYVSSSALYSHNGGNRGLYWYNSTTTGTYGDYQCIVLPSADTTIYPVNTLQLSFWARSSATSYSPTFQVGIMTDPNDINTFLQVATVNVSNSTAWQEYVTSFAGYTGTGFFPAIKATRSTTWYCYVDEIRLEVIPDCQHVQALTASHMTNSTAFVSWTGDTSATSWTVEYGPSNFVPGTGTTLTVSEDTITLSGLLSSTAYDVYVTPVCTGSSAESRVSFTTLCDFIDSLPYYQDFESAASGGSTSYSFVPCWTRLNNGTSYFGYPYVSNSTTYSHNGGSRGLYWYNTTTTGTYGDYQYVVLPGVSPDLEPVNHLQLRFWAKASSTSYSPSFQIGVMTHPDDPSTFEQVSTFNINGNTNWQECFAPLTSYTGTGCFVAVRATRPNSSWYAYVDEFTLELANPCANVYDITPDNVGYLSANVSWSTRGGIEDITEFEMELVPSDSTVSPSSYTTTDHSYSFSGLDAGSSYKVRIRAACDNSTYGDWDSIIFTTLQLPCIEIDSATADTIIFSNSTSTGTSGILVYSGYGNTVCQTIYTAQELTAAGLSAGPIIGIDLGFSQNSSYAKEFTIMMANTTKQTFSSSTDMENMSNHLLAYGPAPHPLGTSGWQHYDFETPFQWDGESNIIMTTFMNQPQGDQHYASSFNGYYTTGSGTRLAYRYQDGTAFNTTNYTGGTSGGTASSRPSIHFYTGECIAYANCMPSMAWISANDSNGVELSWLPSYMENSWNIDYRELGDTAWTNETEGTSDNSYLLTSLEDATRYEIRLSHICDDSLYETIVEVMTPGVYIMQTTGTDTLRTCRSIIYDDGGPDNNYSNNCNGQLVLIPQDTSMTLRIQGRYNSEGCCDYLGIYEGIGTSGRQLYRGYSPSSGQTVNIGPFTSESGPITVTFSSDGSVVYPGFELHTRCVPVPHCADIVSISAETVGTQAANIVWNNQANSQYGDPIGFEYTLYDSTHTEILHDTTTDFSHFFTGLSNNSSYTIYIRTLCPDEQYGNWDSLVFSTVGLPCVEFDTSASNSAVFSNSTETATGVFVTSAWGNSFCQSIYTAQELAEAGISAGAITGITLGYSSTGSYNKDLTIFLSNDTRTSFSSSSEYVSIDSSMRVYGPAAHPNTVSGWVNYTFDSLFYWDGISNLVLTTFMNQPSGSSHTSSNFSAYSTPCSDNTTRTIYRYRDSSPWTLDNYTSGNSSTSTSRPSITFHTYGCSMTGTCAAPTVIVEDYDHTTASLRWAPGYMESSWQVDYRSATDSAWTAVGYTSYDTMTLTGLTPNTDYNIRVTALCGDTNIARIIRLHTLCQPAPLPIYEDFELWTASSIAPLPACWARTSNYSTGTYPYASTSYSTFPGSKSLYFYRYNETYSTLVLPLVDAPIDSINLSFWLMRTNTSYAHSMRVGVMRDPTDMNTFVQVGVATPTGPIYEFEPFEFDFSTYTGNGKYIAITTGQQDNYSYPYLDDLEVNYISSCPRVSGVQLDNATLTSAEISWNNSALSYTVEYGPTGFARGTGTRINHITDSTVILTGLTHSTEYDIYIKGYCSSDSSLWSFRYTFSTECGLIDSLPFHDDLETWRAGSTTRLSMRNCWNYLSDGTYYYPYVGNSSTYSHGGGTKGFYWYRSTSSGSYGNYNGIVLPGIDTTVYPINTLELSFWARNSTNTGQFVLGVMSDPTDYSTFTPHDTVTVTSTNWENYHVPFNLYQGSGNYFAILSTITLSANYFYTYVDDFTIDLAPPCLLFHLRQDGSVPATDTRLAVKWDDNGAGLYQMCAVPEGMPVDSSAITTTTATQAVFTGLNANTAYDIYVRGICNTTDTGRWSKITLQTALCSHINEATIGNISSTSTSYNVPINNFYRYTLSETIIDASELSGMTTIEYLGYYYNYNSPSTVKTNCTIYFQPTTKTSFSSSTDLELLDTTIATRVYTGDLNCHQGWNFFTLDTIFQYSGSGNLMIIIDDNSNAYDGSSYTFRTSATSTYKSLTWYSDSYNPDPTSTSFSGSKTYYQFRPLMKLLSCTATCPEPDMVSDTHSYNSAFITWLGEGTTYQTNLKESIATDWPATDIAVTGTSRNFTGLQPATSYTFRVRTDCTADSLDYSDWVEYSFTTDSLPCYTPDSLHVTAVTNATATFDWNVNGNETAWDIHVWSGTFDSTYRTTLRPATVGGYTAGLTYNAAVRPLCGVNLLEGDWSDTIQFTTATCPDVTGLSTSNVTTNSVTLNWAANPMAQSWTIEYGISGFTQGTGTQATSNTNSYVVTGLTDGLTYDFHVKAVCGTDWNSENWASVTATTEEGGVPCTAPTGVTATAADNSVTVNWTSGTGNISYEIEYGTHGFTHGAGIITSATSSPAVISNLEYETQYDLYVRAICDRNTYSSWSSVATFTTGQRPSDDCDPVQNLSVTDVTETSASVTWQPGPTGDSWQVVLTDAAGTTVSDNVTSSTSASFTGLNTCTNYSVKVRTVCGDDNYSAFITASFKTTGCQGIDQAEGISCTIFPNPATSATTVSVTGANGKVRISVVDMNGRTVATETLECSDDCVKTMEVDHLAQGAYFVRITGDNVNMVKKLIVR